MSWNHPDVNAKKVFVRKGGWCSFFKGLSAALIIVVGIVSVCFFLCDDNYRVSEIRTSNSSKVIKDVAQAVDVPKQTLGVKISSTSTINDRPKKAGEIVNGYLMLPNGNIYRIHSAVTNESISSTLADRVFDEESDRVIGNLLLAEPGEQIIGDGADYYEGFDVDFRNSLKTPIIISQDDDLETKWIKEEVRAIRLDLKCRMDRGEDIVKVIRDTHNQLRELAVYKDQIEQMVKENSLDIDNQNDFNDLVSAANKMLEERGVPPLSMPESFKSTIRHWQAELSEPQKE